MNLSEEYKNRLKKLANISEAETEKEKVSEQEIFLPELSMEKAELLKFLKEVYNLELK